MIHKPRADEFREGTAVTVLRESKTIAVESGRGIADGMLSIWRYWFFGTMGFGVVATLVSHVAGGGGGGFLFLIAIAFVIVMANRSSTERSARIAPAAGAGVAPGVAGRASQSGELHLEIRALARTVWRLIFTAALFVYLSILARPLILGSIVIGGLIVLLGARIFSNRVAMRYDGRSIRVTGLLGSDELLWIDVNDVFVHTFSRFNLAVLFTSGARRNLVISAPCNRLGGSRKLLVPLDLVGLNREQVVSLVDSLASCQAAGGAPFDARQQYEARASLPPRPRITPSHDPSKSFDPDEIIARHLAERAQVIAQNRPDLVASSVAHPPQRVFGRKTG